MPIFKSVFDALPDGVLLVESGGAITLANSAAERMFGYPPGGLVGLSVEALVPQSARGAHGQHRRHYQAEAQARPMGQAANLQGQRQDGTLFPVDIMLAPMALEQGQGTICVVRDARPRKLVEAKLNLANTVFQTTQEAIVVTDENCMVIAVNPAFEKVTEFSEAEVVGRNINVLRSGRHDRDFYREMWRAIRESGSWQGEIWNRRKSGEIYQEWMSISTVWDPQGKPIQYVGVSADMTRINHAETPTERLAHYDGLTGLPNRLLFQSRIQKTLERAHRERLGFAVLFLDLDGFKAVNDRLGHAAGDLLLAQVARRLSHELRETDTVARFGGDEFVIVLEDVKPADVERISQTLIDHIAHPFELGGSGSVQVGLSIGWSYYPDSGLDITSLMHQADEALYRANRRGRGRWMAYSRLD
ncbi:MAG: hypothetical protein RIR00_347 [Pseudomonadota bacterium]|jgi:diguanylate cyclase (GGDEF)-like protein/PAS domain S-box-containing protein